MQKKLKIGWVGSGFVGQVAHLVNYADLENVEIVGLAELRPKLGKLIVEKFGIPKYYTDHKALIENCDADAIVSIVRREHTAPVAYDILQQGFSLFTEKPMAPTYEQAKKLVDLANDKQCVYVTGFMRRHDRGVQLAKAAIKELLASGELGDILYFRAYCFGGGDYCNIDGYKKSGEPPPRHLIWPIAPDWVPKKYEKDYESFLNVFVHDVNLIRYLTDDNPIIGNVDYRKNSGTITLEFVGFPGVFEFAHMETNRYWEEGVEIFFNRGRVVLELPPAFLRNQPATVKIYRELDNRSTEMRNPQADWSWSFREQAKAFVASVITNTDCITSGAESLGDLKFVEDVWRKIV